MNLVIKQLSVFLENRTGRLTDLTRLLGEASINLSAFSIAESSDFGIMRVIVSDPDKAAALLRANHYSVSLTDVVCLQTPNTPGALHKALEVLSDNNIGIEYMYAFSDNGKAWVVISPDRLEDCVRVLRENRQQLLEADEMYSF